MCNSTKKRDGKRPLLTFGAFGVIIIKQISAYAEYIRSSEMKNTIRILMCLALALTMIFCLIACGDKTATVTFDYSEWEDAECDEDERVLEIGSKIGKLPKPTLEGYKFKGWYTEEEYDLLMGGESAEKVKTTLLVEGDITLYAHFESESGSGDNNSGNNGGGDNVSYNCGAGIHKWKYAYTDPTCEAAGTQTSVCELCSMKEIDPLYSTLPANKALGHQWVPEGEDGDGWTTIALGKKRACLREGCTEVESLSFQNLTGASAISSTGAFYGGANKVNLLTDGNWGDGDGGEDCASPNNTGEFSITIEFQYATDVDQIAVSVKGKGNGTGEPVIDGYEIYLWYSDGTDFEETPVASGYFAPEDWGKDNAHLIDLESVEKGIMAIQIKVLRSTQGETFFYELAVAKVPDEE